MEKKQKCGALWIKKDKNGNEYYNGVVEVMINGVVEKKKVVIFKNGFKDAENKPDYIIYPSGDTEQKKEESKDEQEVPF